MLVQDKEELLGHSRIQHGKLSDRVYVMDYRYALDPYLINQIQLLAKDKDYGKIIAKVPKRARAKFHRNGFEIEAKVPGFYNGEMSCLFMAKYNSKERKEVHDKREIDNILNKLKCNDKLGLKESYDQYAIRILAKSDVHEMACIYKNVFKTYPFPIHDVKYIQRAMLEDTIYFGAFEKNKLIGVSSCEINRTEKNVEMTDFAVLAEYRGNKLAKQLLVKMEEVMKSMGIKVTYTIARSISLPMNATFYGNGYEYGGTLWNNTHISGKIESMNVWYKPL